MFVDMDFAGRVARCRCGNVAADACVNGFCVVESNRGQFKWICYTERRRSAPKEPDQVRDE